jgi:hypothetical protein
MWDSQGLRINAANSSLKQILKDIATETGAKVEGLSADQRVFGTYGPGPARDVLSELLVGTGYNVLLIGDRGQGTPREIVLSIGNSGAQLQNLHTPQPSNNDEDADTDEPQQPTEQPRPNPPVNRTPFNPGGPTRTPQQIMQEMQQRDRQAQQQQQNNQPN